jgi:tetratricopeptide (TPR) repeat protein
LQKKNKRGVIEEIFSKKMDFKKIQQWASKYLGFLVFSSSQNNSSNKEILKNALEYNDLGVLYSGKGKYGKAIGYFEKALAIYKKVHGEEYLSTTNDYNRFAEYDYKLLRDISMNGTAAIYNNLGLVYEAKWQYDKAIEYYEKALVIQKKTVGEDHPDTVNSYNNLGGAYYEKGQYDKAIEYYEKALAIQKEVLGEEHPDTARSYNNIGLAYNKAKGQYDKAIEYYEKALVISKKVNGEDRLDTAIIYSGLGLSHLSKGQYDKAIEYYEKALAILTKFLPEDHPDIQTLRKNIEIAKKNRGQ